MAGTDSPAGADGTMPEIVTTEGVLGGEPRIEGHRIGVYQIYQRYVEADDSPEAIATSYDLTVGEVHAALAYAFSNPEAMRAVESRKRDLAAESESDRLRPEDVA